MNVFTDKKTIMNIINGIYNVVVVAINGASMTACGECLDVLSPMKFKLSVRIMLCQKSHSYVPGLPFHGE